MLAGAGLPAGCGIRLEDGAPRLPGTGPHPSVALLSAELQRCRRCHTLAQRFAEGRTRSLPGLHARQITVLTARLEQLRTPVPGPTPTPTSAAGGASRTGTVPIGALIAAEADGLGPPGWTALAALPVSDLALVASLHVQRYLTVASLGGPATAWPPVAVVSEPERVRLLAAYRSAEYGLTVAAAQSDRPHAPAARRTLDQVTATRRTMDAVTPSEVGGATNPDHSGGDAASTAPDVLAEPGYRLPFHVRSPADAQRLGRYVNERLAGAVMAGLPDAAGRPEAVATVLGLTVQARSAAQAWGAAPVAFPGLTTR